MAETVTGLPKKSDKVKVVTAVDFEDDVEKGYVPEGFDSVEDYLTCMRKDYDTDLMSDDDNRKEALTDAEFAAGYQWDPQVLESRTGLPCLTINSIPQFLAQLVGDWRQNRNAIKVLPSEENDVDVASIRADLVRSIEYKSRASRVYDSAFESTVTCGDGAFRVAVEYARDDVFDQDIFIRPIDDALSVVWDRLSVDPTGRDARHVFVEDKLPKKEYDKKWPTKKPAELSQTFSADLRSTGWYDDDSVRIIEHWRMIERDRLLGLFEDGSVHVVEEGSIEKTMADHGPMVRSRIAPCLYSQMHVVTGWDILAGPYEYKLNRVPIIRMMGRVQNVRGRRIRYGLVRFMKDPARLRNFWRSIAAEQLGYSPKAQWAATESAVSGHEEDIRKGHLTRDPLLIFNDEAEFGRNVQKIDPPQVQMALLNEAQVNSQDMKDVTGIHDASLGIKSNETSGKAIRARQMEGDVAALTFYDNGNASILEAGDVINQLIGQIYDGTRIVRLVGEDETPRLQRINDPQDPKSPNLAVGNYDVALTTGASYTTRRAEAAEAMMSAVQVWPQLIQVAGDIIAKAQDWPGAEKLAERLKKTIPPQFLDPEDQEEGQQAPQMDPEQMMAMMEEFKKVSQELETMKMDREIEWYNAETQRIRALSDNEVDGNDMEMRAIENILNHTDKEDERHHKLKVEEMKARKPGPTSSGSNRTQK
jgi:hypothetical protein